MSPLRPANRFLGAFLFQEKPLSGIFLLSGLPVAVACTYYTNSALNMVSFCNPTLFFYFLLKGNYMKNIIAISIFFVLSFAVNAWYSNVQLSEAQEKDLLALPDKELHDLLAISEAQEKELLALSDKEFHDFLAKSVARKKNQLPKEVNPHTSWIDMTIKDKQISNIYIIDEEKLNIPLSAELAELKETGKEYVSSMLKLVPIVIIMVKRGYKIDYQFFDKNKKLLHQFFITQDDLM